MEQLAHTVPDPICSHALYGLALGLQSFQLNAMQSPRLQIKPTYTYVIVLLKHQGLKVDARDLDSPNETHYRRRRDIICIFWHTEQNRTGIMPVKQPSL